MDADALVLDYLGRLEAATGRLAVDRRVELVGEVREHIASSLAEAGRRDELTVRNILERLGPPEEIVAAEWETDADAAAPAQATTPPTGPDVAPAPWGAVEIAALLLVTVGAVLLPLVGPLLGLAFVWMSARWTKLQKSVVTAIVLTLLLLLVLLLLSVYGRAV